MNTQTRNKISYLTFILSLAIIWHHTYNVNVYGLTGVLANTERYLLNIWESSVSVFFLISAFLLFYNLDSSNVLQKTKKRVLSLVVPYLFWNLIGYLYYQIVSLFPFIRNNYGGTIEHFSIVGLLKSTINGEYNPVTWFLFSLIVYSFVSLLLYKFLKNKYCNYFCLIISIILGSIYGSKSNVLAYSSYFLLGIVFAVNYKQLFLSRCSKIIRITSLIVYLILMFVYTVLQIPDRCLSRIIIFNFSSILVWIFADFLAIETKPKWWMNFSFVSYVSHEFILEPIEKIFFIVLGNNIIGAIIDYLVAPIITTIVIIIMCLIFKRIPFIWKIASGGRN